VKKVAGYWDRIRRQKLLSWTFAPVWFVFIVFLVAFVFADRQARIIHVQTERAGVQETVSLMRSRLENIIHSDVQLVRGLVAFVSTRPDITQSDFSAFAAEVLGDSKNFINIAVAPDYVVTLVHPVGPNQSVLGLDYRDARDQGAAAMMVKETGEMVFAGPLDLVQGGTGFIARFPVFVEREGVTSFWGIISAVLDVSVLYGAAGLGGVDHGLNLALRGRDGLGADGAVFFGDPAVFDAGPVQSDIVLPVGTWQLAAIPVGGWTTSPARLWFARLAFVLLGALVLMPTVLMCRFAEQRNDIINSLFRKERQLMDQQKELQKLSTVVESASDSIIISGPDARIQWVNAAFTEITGYTSDEVIGKTPAQVLNGPGTDPETTLKIRARMEAGERFRTEILNYTKDKRELWIETFLVPVLDVHRAVSFVAAIERDITAAKAQKRDLAWAKERAEAADRAKSEFIATMSHEIRTPMNGIIGMAELLSESELPVEAKGQVKIVHDSAQSLLAIINDILDLSRLEAGKLDLSECDFDLRTCIEGALGLVRGVALGKGLQLCVAVSDDVPRYVRGDDGRLRQILLNLLGNAVKFTSEGMVALRVTCAKNVPNRLIFEVEDTGIGLSETQIPVVFDRFAQADAGIARQFGGTGLGLSIVRHLAEQMGGAVSVRSDLGRGSCFTLEIQTKPAVAIPQPERADSETDVTGLRGQRLLLVEDNSTNRFIVHRFLSGLGLEIWDAEDGVEAIEVFEQVQPDLVLMDMSMPKMDGLEATRRIRALGLPQPPIIALTANAFDSDRTACLLAGMDDFLSKPLRKKTLLAALATHNERFKKQVAGNDVRKAV
jgi:hypothetical protein